MHMLKTGITLMKVTCHHARECHAEMMEYASHIRTTCMITPATARQDSVESTSVITVIDKHGGCMVPSSSSDVACALRGCFRGGFAYVLFTRRRKSFQAAGMLSMIFQYQRR